MFEDKIVKGGEIIAKGNFKAGTSAFYLMLVPKVEDTPVIAVLSVKLSQNKGDTDFPFSVGIWNPVVVNSVDVKESDLTNYRIFWGSTL